MNFLRKISSYKGALWVTIVALVLGLPLVSFAGLDPITGLLSQVFYLAFIYIPGWILALVTQVLVWVLRYQDFAHEEIIIRGWTVLRDLSNMFFIIVLVVVAVGTIVKSGRYGYQQNLRRLILMAILINFSKTITLFFIDLSQAITISFVNAFLDAIQGGFPSLLGLTGVLSLEDADKLSLSGGLNVFLQIGLGGVMLLVSVVIVSVITFLFLMRIIFFAFLIILSPIAFLCSTLPTAQKYYHEWWDVLGKYLVLGPTLAFFLWLAFSVVQTGGTGQLSGQVYVNSGVSTVNLGASGTDTDPFLQNSGNTATTTQNPLAASLTRFFVAISLLFGSLMMAGKLGTVGAGISKQASGKLTGLGKSVLVGRSGAGGIVGTARSISAVPVRNFGNFATNAMDSGTNKFSDFSGRAIGGLTRIVTRNDRAAQVAGDIARAGVKGTTQAIGGAALSPYLRGMQAYARADDSLRSKDVKFKAAEAKGKSEKEIYRGLSSLDSNAAQADAEQYVEKNMMNNPAYGGAEHSDTRKAVYNKLKSGENEKMLKDFASTNVDLLSDEEAKLQTEGIVQTGETVKAVTNQVNPTAKLIQQLDDAGAARADMEKGIKSGNKAKQAQWVTAYKNRLDDLLKEYNELTKEADQALREAIAAGKTPDEQAEISDSYAKKTEKLQGKVDGTRQTLANIDTKNLTLYATKVDFDPTTGAPSAKISDIDPTTVKADSLDREVLEKMVRSMKGADLASVSTEMFKTVGAVMTKTQFTSLSKLGSPQQMTAALQSLVDEANSRSDVTSASFKKLDELVTQLVNKDVAYSDLGISYTSRVPGASGAGTPGPSAGAAGPTPGSPTTGGSTGTTTP